MENRFIGYTYNTLTYFGSIILTWILAFFFLMAFQVEETKLLSTSRVADLNNSFWSGILAGFIWGIIFKVSRSLRRYIPTYSLSIITSVSVNILSAYLLLYVIYHLSDIFIFDDFPKSFQQLMDLYNSQMFYSILAYFFIVGTLIEIFIEIDNKLGRGVLIKFLLGRYYKPKEEERIFLFMDLKSSTSYAERLGHFKYSRLIQDCFKDISPAIAKNEAQIYQYVGDEVVLTWKLEDGVKNKRCLQVFFDFMDELNKKKAYYQKEYGLIPVFKAGVHSGKVMVAEVGELKSEIAYHGDAINTASRIQGLCNSYQSKLLVSGNLIQELKSNQFFDGWYEPLGSVLLNGKQLTTTLYKIC
ncbi:adenylate/guanylate cyclase domain-containing protein [Marinifilum caeruleilacunae]|jgi:adenylate cyclase|nr:adenylate/guanylate cyclase domain-containing protein [Marinifilum caeruleilacunae]